MLYLITQDRQSIGFKRGQKHIIPKYTRHKHLKKAGAELIKLDNTKDYSVNFVYYDNVERELLGIFRLDEKNNLVKLPNMKKIHLTEKENTLN